MNLRRHGFYWLDHGWFHGGAWILRLIVDDLLCCIGITPAFLLWWINLIHYSKANLANLDDVKILISWTSPTFLNLDSPPRTRKVNFKVAFFSNVFYSKTNGHNPNRFFVPKSPLSKLSNNKKAGGRWSPSVGARTNLGVYGPLVLLAEAFFKKVHNTILACA